MADTPFSRTFSTCWRLCTGLGIPAQMSQAGKVNWRVHPKAGEYPELTSILESPEQGIVSGQRGLFGSKSDFVYHQHLVVKRYNVRKPSDALLDLIRPSKATFAFRKARLLEDIGIPVAAAIAAGDAPRRSLVQHCYLIMERVPGAQTYRTFFEAGGDPAHARTLGTLIGRVHGNGLRHRDLRCENLLEDDQGKTWFIDMEGIRVQLLPRPNRVLRDLRALYRNFARFQAKPAPGVMATFWRHYLREQPRGARRQFIAARRQIFGK